MDTRNLNRIFAASKALRLYNSKDAENVLKHRDVIVLLSIVHIGNSCRFSGIMKHLRAFNHTLSIKQLDDKLKDLVLMGYVSSNGRHPALYSLTVSGVNVVKVLEKRCRNTRIDK